MATVIWSAPSAGNWSVSTNWNTSAVPTSSDDVIFNNLSVQNCNVNTGVNVLSIIVSGNYTGTITQNGHVSAFSAEGSWAIPVSSFGGFSANGKWNTNGYNLETNNFILSSNANFSGTTSTIKVRGNINIDSACNANFGSSTLFWTPTTSSTISNPNSNNAFYNFIANDCCTLYCNFDETVSPAIDKSGYGRNGVWTNNATYNTNRPTTTFPNSASVDSNANIGSGPYVWWAGNNINNSEAPFSFALTIYPSVPYANAIDGGGCCFTVPLGYDPWFAWAFFGWNDGGINGMGWQFPPAGWAGVYYSGFPTSAWTNVVCTVGYDGSSAMARMYINGLLANPGGGPVYIPTMYSYHQGLSLLSQTGSWRWQGLVDNLRFYKKELTSAEAANFGNSGCPGVSMYPMIMQSNIRVKNEFRLVAGDWNFGSYNLEVSGDYNNLGGKITKGNGGVVLIGNANQSFLDGNQQYNNVIIANTNSATVSFVDPLNVGGVLSAVDPTPSSAFPIRLTFNEIWQHYVNQFALGGVMLRSAVSGNQWDVSSTTNSTGIYVNVQDSNLQGATVTVNDGTSYDAGNNSSNWIFTAITVIVERIASVLRGAYRGIFRGMR